MEGEIRQMKKTDFYTMLYQFAGAGLVFFFAAKFTGKTIYPLEFLGISIGFTSGLLVMNSILFLGVFGLMIQRKIYVNEQIKKVIARYKSREI